MNNGWHEFIRSHKWTILSVALGILITVLIFTINFWRTLLLIIVVGLCYIVGTVLDRGGRGQVKAFFDRILPKR